MPNNYYAVVDTNGGDLRDWTQASAPIVQVLYHHANAKLLICHESPDDQEDCRIVATIEAQLTLEDIGLTPHPGSRLLETLDALLGAQLDCGVNHYGAAHAKRLAYLTLYFATLKHLAPRDTNLLLLAAYLHDFGYDHPGFNGGDGLIRFNRYLDGRGRFDPELLHATFAATLARAGQPWSLADTDRLLHVLAESRVTGWARRLQVWAADLRQLDVLRFGHPADLGALHDHDAMRLLYASQQELNLIPDRKLKERSK
ncbi:MAG: HD domain-containing protein [Lactobacillus sp.]|jgi:hypothetical protein|nr:HD domain-containing protein [Lactobacillus sp.]MCI2033308.1 HD domain-containing protein [Lactobacillus sp.]